ncbi:pectinesterase family protein [Novosphingobium sp. SCN 63-17]|nr:pectinesterase [Novosphingobium sp. 1748]
MRDKTERWITIRVAPGDYHEKPVIARPRLRLIGADRARTRIHFGAVAQTAKEYHRNGWGTPGSATLTIDADEVEVRGITIENTYDYLANDRIPYGDPARIGNPQAAAVLFDIHADRVLMRGVAMLGYQDTVFTNGGRALVQDSLIAGNIDFIFGNGQLLIEHSEIRSRPRAQPPGPDGFQSFVAAPSTPLSQPTGIVFYASHLTREKGVPDGAVALGRPWHPTTRFADGRYADPAAVGMALYIDCVMDRHIHADRWTTMNGTSRDGTVATVFRPQDSRFGEVGSSGPGAQGKGVAIAWKEERTYAQIRSQFLSGWALTDR